MIEWIDIDEEPPVDDLRVLLCNVHGHIYLGTRDEYGYWDDHCERLHDIVAWADPPTAPWAESAVTNTKWIDYITKNGYIK